MFDDHCSTNLGISVYTLVTKWWQHCKNKTEFSFKNESYSAVSVCESSGWHNKQWHTFLCVWGLWRVCFWPEIDLRLTQTSTRASIWTLTGQVAHRPAGSTFRFTITGLCLDSHFLMCIFQINRFSGKQLGMPAPTGKFFTHTDTHTPFGALSVFSRCGGRAEILSTVVEKNWTSLTMKTKITVEIHLILRKSTENNSTKSKSFSCLPFTDTDTH